MKNQPNCEKIVAESGSQVLDQARTLLKDVIRNSLIINTSRKPERPAGWLPLSYHHPYALSSAVKCVTAARLAAPHPRLGPRRLSQPYRSCLRCSNMHSKCGTKLRPCPPCVTTKDESIIKACVLRPRQKRKTKLQLELDTAAQAAAEAEAAAEETNNTDGTSAAGNSLVADGQGNGICKLDDTPCTPSSSETTASTRTTLCCDEQSLEDVDDPRSPNRDDMCLKDASSCSSPQPSLSAPGCDRLDIPNLYETPNWATLCDREPPARLCQAMLQEEKSNTDKEQLDSQLHSLFVAYNDHGLMFDS